MAQNYLLFSAALPLHTEEETVWWRSLEERQRDWNEEPDGDEPLGCKLTFDPDGTLVLYADEYGSPSVVVVRVQEFLKEFDRKDEFVLEWAETCSQPRPGCFGGGAVIVTKDDENHMSTGDFVAQHLGC